MARPYGKNWRYGQHGKQHHGRADDPAAEIRQCVVDLFDKGDGNGVDWKEASEAVFKAGFKMLDDLPSQQKEALARRVCISTYTRFNGDWRGNVGSVDPPPRDSKPDHLPEHKPGPEERPGDHGRDLSPDEAAERERRRRERALYDVGFAAPEHGDRENKNAPRYSR